MHDQAIQAPSPGATRWADDRPEVEPSRPRWYRVLKIVPGLLVTCAFAILHVSTLGYGPHWDEKNLYDALERSAQRGSFLPAGFYDYPSITYSIVVAAAMTQIREPWHDIVARPFVLRDKLVSAASDRSRLLLASREAFCLISSLCLLWLYLAVLIWRESVGEAVLAALLLGTSWEFSYHARWVAPDLILTQFACLLLVTLVMVWRGARKPGFLRVSAVAAGLACGSKYPGGLLLLPVIATALAPPGVCRKYALGRRALLAFQCAAIFAVTYLVTTPGTLLEPFDFWTDLQNVSRQYATAMFGYTVTPGLMHLQKACTYLGAVFFSHFMPLAVFLTLVMVAGFIDLVARQRVIAAIFLSFPVVDFLFFTSRHVMVVRNLLVLTPFMAILAARGFFAIGAISRSFWWRGALLASVGATLSLNTYWLAESARSIWARGGNRAVRELDRYVRNHSETRFYATPGVAGLLRCAGLSVPPNMQSADLLAADQILIGSREAMAREADWTANNPFLFERWFGGYQVNLDYYPTWRSGDHILVMTREKAQQADIAALRYHALENWLRSTRDLRTAIDWGQSREVLMMHPHVGAVLGLGWHYEIPLPPGPATHVRFAATSPEYCVDHTDGVEVRLTVISESNVQTVVAEQQIVPEQVRRRGYIPVEGDLPARNSAAKLQIWVGPGPARNGNCDWCWIAPVCDRLIGGPG